MKSLHTQKRRYINNIMKVLFIALIATVTMSCEDTPDCEMQNTGNLIIENTSRNSTLQLFINENGAISINGPGDVSIPAGERQSISLPAGLHNIKARLRYSSCSGSRCSISTKGLPEREVDLDACEDKNLIY